MKIKNTPQAENKQAAKKSGIDEDVVKYIQNNIMQLPTSDEPKTSMAMATPTRNEIG